MSKVKTRTQENNSFSVLQDIRKFIFNICGWQILHLSWMGVNLTPFMGSASRFSPIIFGVIGSVLLNMN